MRLDDLQPGLLVCCENKPRPPITFNEFVQAAAAPRGNMFLNIFRIDAIHLPIVAVRVIWPKPDADVLVHLVIDARDFIFHRVSEEFVAAILPKEEAAQ